MPARYFTVAEANELLTTLEPLVGQLLERRAKVVRDRKEIEDVIDDLHSNVGGQTASEMTREFIIIDRLIKKIQSHGCVLKDVNVGLLDFLAERNGREVYLCWRYGEPRIEYYHDLHTGFNGRQPV